MSEALKVDKEIDIRGLVCPYTFVKAKLAVEELQVGQTLRVLLDWPEAAHNIPRSMAEHGQKLSVKQLDEKQWEIIIKKEVED